MTSIQVAILGFGTVGEGIYRILTEKSEEFKRKTGYRIEIASILVQDITKTRPPTPGTKITGNVQDILANPDIDVIFEAIVGEEPAYTYLSAAIEKGCHVITANKTMFAKYGPALLKHAEFRNVQFGYEATTAGGVPIISTLTNLIKGDRVKKVCGILNGTSNFILTKMRKEEVSFEIALQEAQKLGYAEAESSDDIGGKDAFRKLMILSGLAFDRQPKWKEVPVVGITGISVEDVKQASNDGYRYRHVAEIGVDEEGQIIGNVSPELIEAEHPLYGVDGVDNAIIIETEYLGSLTLIGPGAGMYPTASAMVGDLLQIIGNREKTLAIS